MKLFTKYLQLVNSVDYFDSEIEMQILEPTYGYCYTLK